MAVSAKPSPNVQYSANSVLRHMKTLTITRYESEHPSMHEGDVKPFEEMSHEELILAARFWQSEYERVVREHSVASTTFTWFPKCPACGIHHDPAVNCLKLSDGTVMLQFSGSR